MACYTILDYYSDKDKMHVKIRLEKIQHQMRDLLLHDCVNVHKLTELEASHQT